MGKALWHKLEKTRIPTGYEAGGCSIASIQL